MVLCVVNFSFRPSAMTSNLFTGLPPRTIAHAVRLELHPSEQQQPAAYTYTVPAFPHVSFQSHLPRSFSCTWPGQTEASQSVTLSASSLELFVKNFVQCTPDITLGGPKETYHIHCFRAGSYQCTATGLVFVVDGQGDVRYSVVSWDWDLLASHCKKPAGMQRNLFHSLHVYVLLRTLASPVQRFSTLVDPVDSSGSMESFFSIYSITLISKLLVHDTLLVQQSFTSRVK